MEAMEVAEGEEMEGGEEGGEERLANHRVCGGRDSRGRRTGQATGAAACGCIGAGSRSDRKCSEAREREK